MFRKATLLFFPFLFCAFFSLRAEQPSPVSTPSRPASSSSSSSWDRTRLEVNGALQRIRAKISYSWMRSNEYFRLMITSVEEKAATETKNVRFRTSVKTDDFKKSIRKSKEELAEKTRDLYKKSDAVSDEISEKTARVKEEIEEMGKQFYKDASREVGKTVDSFQK